MPGILSRISTLIGANINAMIDNAEDPEKMVAEYLRQLNEQLSEARAATAQAMAVEQDLLGKQQTHVNAADNWQGKAEMAVRANNDELATEALTRKANESKIAQQYRIQYDAQHGQVSELRQALANLEAKISEAQTKQEVIRAKIARARSQQAINQANASMTNPNATSSFDRMDQKADEDLYRAQAEGQLQSGNDLDAQFRDLETQGEVQNDLAALKAKLGK